MPIRFLVALALSAVPLTAMAQSDLDRLSATRGFSAPHTPGFEARVLPPALPPDEAAAPLPGGEPTQVPGVPIDGGLSLLALAGAGYAAKRLRARRA